MTQDWTTYRPSTVEEKDRTVVVTINHPYFTTEEHIRDFEKECRTICDRRYWRYVFNFENVIFFPRHCLRSLVHIADKPATKRVALCNMCGALVQSVYEDTSVRDRFFLVATLHDARLAVKK